MDCCGLILTEENWSTVRKIVSECHFARHKSNTLKCWINCWEFDHLNKFELQDMGQICDMDLTNIPPKKPCALIVFNVILLSWCRIHLWFRLRGGLQAKSMTSQRYWAVTRWRIYVTMATLWQQQDGGYALLFYIFDSTVIEWTCYFFPKFPGYWGSFPAVKR